MDYLILYWQRKIEITMSENQNEIKCYPPDCHNWEHYIFTNKNGDKIEAEKERQVIIRKCNELSYSDIVLACDLESNYNSYVVASNQEPDSENIFSKLNDFIELRYMKFRNN